MMASPEQTLLDSYGLSGLVHVWGQAGSGKTLFASLLAADESRLNHVLWISTDGKLHFASRLKELVRLRNGSASNITIVSALGHVEANQAVFTVRERLRSDTRLVVVDPITRVLDMEHVDDLMWGRNLFEETMPVLAALCSSGERTVVIISEVRESETGAAAVHHDTISRWASHDLELRRDPGSAETEVLAQRNGQSTTSILRFGYDKSGLRVVRTS